MAKKLKWNLILMSLLYLALGIFLLMVPGTALNVVCYALGGVVLACAAVQLVRYFVVERGVFQSQLTLISGLVCLALGAFLIIRSDVVVRVGAEQRILRSRVLALRLRAGAFLEPTPLSSDLPSSAAFDRGSKTVVQVPTRYFDATRLGLTWGVGLTFAKFPLDFDLYGQYQALLPRELTFAAGGPNGATATSTASGSPLPPGSTPRAAAPATGPGRIARRPARGPATAPGTGTEP